MQNDRTGTAPTPADDYNAAKTPECQLAVSTALEMVRKDALEMDEYSRAAADSICCDPLVLSC